MPRDQNHMPLDMSRPALSIRRSLAADQSSNMLEVLQGGPGTQQPPAPQHIRVRDMGRNNKERDEVCQWIHSMLQVEETPAPPETTRNPSPLSTRASSVRLETARSGEVDATSNAAMYNPRTCEDPSLKGRAGENTCLDSKSVSVFPSESVCPSKSDVESETGANHSQHATAKEDISSRRTGSGEEPSFEEQLEMIRKQQQELLEQKRIIQGKLELKKSESKRSTESETQQDTRELVSQAVLSTPEVAIKDPSRATSDQVIGTEARRRRLKGSLASRYAKRDEGSIGYLLCSDESDRNKPVSSTTSNALSCVKTGRLANLKQESSSTISEILSHTSFVQSHSQPFNEPFRVPPRRCTSDRSRMAGNPSSKVGKSPVFAAAAAAMNDIHSKADEIEIDSSPSTCITSCTKLP